MNIDKGKPNIEVFNVADKTHSVKIRWGSTKRRA